MQKYRWIKERNCRGGGDGSAELNDWIVPSARTFHARGSLMYIHDLTMTPFERRPLRRGGDQRNAAVGTTSLGVDHERARQTASDGERLRGADVLGRGDRADGGRRSGRGDRHR